MTKYLDPTNDVAFRKLFGAEGHESLLISFFNAILDLKGTEKIKKVQAPLIKNALFTIFEVKCTDATGKEFIIKLQNRKVPAFVKKRATLCYV